MSVAERHTRAMETANFDERILTAVRADRLFKTFQIEMTPEEVRSFEVHARSYSVAPPFDLFPLIDQIDALIPPSYFGASHPQSGKVHHSYKIGRENGFRLLKIELFKGFFPSDYDFVTLLEKLHSLGASESAKVLIAGDNNSYSIELRWGGRNE